MEAAAEHLCDVEAEHLCDVEAEHLCDVEPGYTISISYNRGIVIPRYTISTCVNI
jgi:hypothetical protein